MPANDERYKITIVAIAGSSGAIEFDAVDAVIDQGDLHSKTLTLSDNVVGNPTILNFTMNYSLAFAFEDTIELVLPYFEATSLDILSSIPAAKFQVTSIGTNGTESFSLLFTINGTVQDEDEIYLQIGGLKNPTNSTPSSPGYKVRQL